MSNVIDLEAYRSKKMDEEIDSLKRELKDLVAEINPSILSQPTSDFFSTIYDERYLLTTPLAGSYFGHANFCPCCGYDYSGTDLFVETKDES